MLLFTILAIAFIIIFTSFTLITGTFDISRVNYTIHPRVISITIDYVHGAESPHLFYVELQCTSQTLLKLFNGSSGSINNVPSNEQCILLVTDGDAMNSINETTPFNKTIQTDNNVDYSMGSPTPSPNPPRGQLSIVLIIFAISIGIAVALTVIGKLHLPSA